MQTREVPNAKHVRYKFQIMFIYIHDIRTYIHMLASNVCLCQLLLHFKYECMLSFSGDRTLLLHEVTGQWVLQRAVESASQQRVTEGNTQLWKRVG